MTTALSGTLLLAGLTFSQNRDIRWQPELTEDWTPVEDSVSTTGHFAEPPSDAIILFDGSDLSERESAPGYFTSMGSVPEYIEELQKEEVPYFDESGKVVKPGHVTVLHNGVLIHHKVELQGPTVYIGQPHYEEHPHKLPIGLQDHSNPVSFRNIWVREL